jgi:hypothetical protein
MDSGPIVTILGGRKEKHQKKSRGGRAKDGPKSLPFAHGEQRPICFRSNLYLLDNMARAFHHPQSAPGISAGAFRKAVSRARVRSIPESLPSPGRRA